MLFSRIYSWIKYKSLPPSVLFLNRLYVERDSKSRRVTSNLGLTFRNSKWSSYARTNINLKNKTDYAQLLLRVTGLFFLAVVLINLSNYYSSNSLTDFHYTFIWFVLDADLYLKTLFSSALICTAQLALSSAYNWAYSSIMGKSFSAPSVEQPYQSFSLPKRLHKPVLYSLLKNSTDVDRFSRSLDIFPKDNSVVGFYSNLYSSARLLRLTSIPSSHSLSTFNFVSKRSTLIESELTKTSFSADTTTLALDYFLFNHAQPSSVSYFTELNKWSLSTLHRELESDSNYLTSLSGLFYSPSITSSRLSELTINFSELSELKQSLGNQLTAIRWQRWLYKYNLLHRSVLSGTGQINLAKKLLNSGFYTSTLTTNNIWASSAFNDSTQTVTKIQDLHESLYGSSFLQTNSKVLLSGGGFLNSSNIESLGLYELSYNWFIKRFYVLNTLNSNRLTTRPVVKLDNNLTSNVALFNTASSSLSSDLSYAAAKSNSSLELRNENPSSFSSAQGALTSDNYLNYIDSSYLTKGRLELIQNMVKSRSTSSTLFYKSSVPFESSWPRY